MNSRQKSTNFSMPVDGKSLRGSEEVGDVETKGGLIPYLMVILFLLILVAGVNAGEVSAVWEKAITICLSCMGVG
jgi:hypothetical protein